MCEYVVVIQFQFTDAGAVFYLAHVFTREQAEDGSFLFTLQLTVSADSPEQAIEKANDLAWLVM